MSRTAFLRMLQAYRETFGKAYPQRDPISVFKVLEQVAAPVPTSQVAIAVATKLNSAEVNKIIERAVESGWVHREKIRTSSGAKMVSLTDEGERVLSRFEKRCREACDDSSVRSSATTDIRRTTPAKRRVKPATTDADIDALIGLEHK